MTDQKSILTVDSLWALLIADFHKFAQGHGIPVFHWHINIFKIFWICPQLTWIPYAYLITFSSFHRLCQGHATHSDLKDLLYIFNRNAISCEPISFNVY